jgi:glycosyltransferase involved in cell wall biosynthesis
MNELGIESTVRLHDWLSQHQVHDLLDHAHVLVLPSRNEGQPMAVLEAMARGMCVISSSAGGLGEMIGDDCGVIVPPDDVDAIVDALRLVVADGGFRRQCGESAYQRVRQQFDAGVVATQIEDLYRWVCR